MKRHGVGFVDSGWVVNTHHVKAWRGIRDADITAICDIHEKRAKSAAALCMQLNVGDPKVCTDASKMAADPHVDAIWITVPNYARIPVVEAVTEVAQGTWNPKEIAKPSRK